MPATAYLPLALTYLTPGVVFLAMARLVWLLTQPITVARSDESTDWARVLFARRGLLAVVLGIGLGGAWILVVAVNADMKPGFFKGAIVISSMLAIFLLVWSICLWVMLHRKVIAPSTTGSRQRDWVALAVTGSAVLVISMMCAGIVTAAPSKISIDAASFDELWARRTVISVCQFMTFVQCCVVLNLFESSETHRASILPRKWIQTNPIIVFIAMLLPFLATNGIMGQGRVLSKDGLLRFIAQRDQTGALTPEVGDRSQSIVASFWLGDAVSILLLIFTAVVLLSPMVDKVCRYFEARMRSKQLSVLFWFGLSLLFLWAYPPAAIVGPPSAVFDKLPIIVFLLGGLAGLMAPYLEMRLPPIIEHLVGPIFQFFGAPSITILCVVSITLWVIRLMSPELEIHIWVVFGMLHPTYPGGGWVP